MHDVDNGRIETENSMKDRVPGYPGPEPDGYSVPKIPESPSAMRQQCWRNCVSSLIKFVHIN